MRKVVSFIFAALFASWSHAEVQIVTVNAWGEGINRSEAIKAAQVQAVGQVSGELLEAHTDVNRMSAELRVNGDGDQAVAAARSRSVSSSVESLVKGVIKSTKVLRADINPKTGLFEAEIIADVAKVGQSAQLKRRRIAVLSVASTREGNNIHNDVLREAVESGLVASRKMAVLDRNEFTTLESEVQLMLSGRVPIEEHLKAMNMPTADLMGLVSIESIREIRDPSNMPITELIGKINVIDVASRQIKLRKTLTARYPGTKESVTSRVSKLAGERLAKAVLDFAYPMLVISAREGTVVVSAGSTQLRKGQSVKFYRIGRELKDPYTGEVVGRDEIDVGGGEVINVDLAIARVNSKDFEWDPSVDYVVKPAEPKEHPLKKTISESDW